MPELNDRARDERAPASEPLVSIIICSYNHAQYIDEAIKSVFDQEYRNWELIICDDGSSDNSHEVLRKYQSSPRVSLYLNEKNQGQGVMLNAGIDAARGDFICFLSSDDIFFPNKLKSQVRKLQSCPENVGVVYSDGLFFEDGVAGFTPSTYHSPKTGDIFRDLIVETCIFPVSPLSRRAVFEQERFWPGFAAEGEAIYTRIARRWRFDYIPEATCAMRRHTYNIGRKFETMYYENLRWWNKFLQETPGLGADVVALIRDRIAYQHRLAGLSYVRLSGEYAKGRKALVEAIKARPHYALDWKVLAGLAMTFMPHSAAQKG